MKKYYFAVDLGATSGRTILGTLADGRLEQEELTRFPNNLIETGGHFYWDIYALYFEMIRGLKEVARRGITLTSIGIDTWGVDFVFIGKDGAILRNPMAYRDPHTFGRMEEYLSHVVSRRDVYDITGIQFLKYSDSITYTGDDKKSHTEDITLEYIQPYLVQYNESFYDFLVRTANRCGEFLFFEDGKLTLGLPLAGETPYKISYYESVTRQDISDGPFKVDEYARDSVKDGETAPGDFNFTAIAKESTHYPSEAFPSEPAYNCEISTQEYIFPLFKGKWSSVGRELYYDGPRPEAAVGKIIQVLKSALADKTEGDPTFKNAGMAFAKAAAITPLFPCQPVLRISPDFQCISLYCQDSYRLP